MKCLMIEHILSTYNITYVSLKYILNTLPMAEYYYLKVSGLSFYNIEFLFRLDSECLHSAVPWTNL